MPNEYVNMNEWQFMIQGDSINSDASRNKMIINFVIWQNKQQQYIIYNWWSEHGIWRQNLNKKVRWINKIILN